MTDSKKKRTRRTFSDEFKREAAALYRSSDISAEQVGAELGVSASLIYRWSREFSEANAPEGQPTYKDLEKEHRRLRRELDFLKKASSYCASQQSNGMGS